MVYGYISTIDNLVLTAHSKRDEQWQWQCQKFDTDGLSTNYNNNKKQWYGDLWTFVSISTSEYENSQPDRNDNYYTNMKLPRKASRPVVAAQCFALFLGCRADTIYNNKTHTHTLIMHNYKIVEGKRGGEAINILNTNNNKFNSEVVGAVSFRMFNSDTLVWDGLADLNVKDTACIRCTILKYNIHTSTKSSDHGPFELCRARKAMPIPFSATATIITSVSDCARNSRTQSC